MVEDGSAVLAGFVAPKSLIRRAIWSCGQGKHSAWHIMYVKGQNRPDLTKTTFPKLCQESMVQGYEMAEMG